MEKAKLLELGLEKVGTTLKGIDSLMTSSFECETLSKKDPFDVKSALRTLNGGSVPEAQKYDGVNVGNGWNSDGHQDGTVNAYDNLRDYYDFEVSSSPVKANNFQDLRNELQSMYNTLAEATTMKHSCMASSHIHLTIRYSKIETSRFSDEFSSAIKINSKEVYNRIARFMVKYMPILKWWCMTTSTGARGSLGMETRYGDTEYNPYDKLDDDALFSWYRRYQGEVSDSSALYLKGMRRGSYMRIHRTGDLLHWENRMPDQTASHTHMATLIALNKALTLWAIDMTNKGYNLLIDNSDVVKSQEEMRNHRRGFEYVDREYIEQQSLEVISYLSKYLAIANNLDCVKYLEKLTKKSISEYLQSKDIYTHFDPQDIEKAFNERNRSSDEGLRTAYLESIDAMVVPFAKSLNDFHSNCAEFLGVPVNQVKSLYQMLNRENVDLRWLGGRLVHMN